MLIDEYDVPLENSFTCGFYDEMGAKADEAIQQIEDKKYDMDLKNDGYKYVSYYGIAFCGKECVVHCKACGITERKR